MINTLLSGSSLASETEASGPLAACIAVASHERVEHQIRVQKRCRIVSNAELSKQDFGFSQASSTNKTQQEFGFSQSDNIFSIIDPSWPIDIANYLLVGSSHSMIGLRILTNIRADRGGERVRMLLHQAAAHKGSHALDFAIDLLSQAPDELYRLSTLPLHELPEEAWYIVLGAVVRSTLPTHLQERILSRFINANSAKVRDGAATAIGRFAYLHHQSQFAVESLRHLAADPDSLVRETAQSCLDDFV